MRIRQFILIFALGIASAFTTGCCTLVGNCKTSSNGPVTIGSGSQSFAIYTFMAGGGIWKNAQLHGEGDPTTVQCPSSDPGCLTMFGPVGDGPEGELIVQTDDLPSNWEAFADGAQDPNCPDGASSSWVSESNEGNPIELTCGGTDPVGGSVQPSQCTVTYVNNQLYQPCPSYIEAVSNGSVVFPTTQDALTITFYDIYGDWQGSEQATAQSSTIVSFPAPTNWGINVITVTGNTGYVLVGAGYTLHECLVTVDYPNSSTYCPY
jgi:hypothetical protein